MPRPIQGPEGSPPSQVPPSFPRRLLSGLIAFITLKGVRAAFASRNAKQLVIKELLGTDTSLADKYRGILESMTYAELCTLKKTGAFPEMLEHMEMKNPLSLDRHTILKKLAGSKELQETVSAKQLTINEILGNNETLAIKYRDILKKMTHAELLTLMQTGAFPEFLLLLERIAPQDAPRILKETAASTKWQETLSLFPIIVKTQFLLRLSDQEVWTFLQQVKTSDVEHWRCENALATLNDLLVQPSSTYETYAPLVQDLEQNQTVDLFKNLGSKIMERYPPEEIKDYQAILSQFDPETQEVLRSLPPGIFKYLKTEDTTLLKTRLQQIASNPLWVPVIQNLPLFERIRVYHPSLTNAEVYSIMEALATIDQNKVNTPHCLAKLELFMDEWEKGQWLSPQAVRLWRELSPMPSVMMELLGPGLLNNP